MHGQFASGSVGLAPDWRLALLLRPETRPSSGLEMETWRPGPHTEGIYTQTPGRTPPGMQAAFDDPVDIQ